MQTPQYDFDDQQSSARNDSQAEEDKIVASLYQDIDMEIDDRFSAPLSSKHILQAPNSGKTRNFHFSIPIQSQKLNSQSPLSAQYFASYKLAGAGPAPRFSNSTKCEMDSPSFCKGDSDAFSPSLPVPNSEDIPRDSHEPIKRGISSDSETKSLATQESTRRLAITNSDVKNQQKSTVFGAFQDSTSRKSQNISKNAALNVAPEYGISKPACNIYAQRSERASSTRSAGFEKNEHKHLKVPSYFFEEKTAAFNNELQRPESSPDLDKTHNTGSAVQTSRTAGIEVSYLELADPLSLGNFDDKLRRSNPVSTQVSSRKNLMENMTKAGSNSKGYSGLSSSKSTTSLKTNNTVERKALQKNNSLYKKILAQGKKPKEIEVQVELGMEQKQNKTPLNVKNTIRSVTPKGNGIDNLARQTSPANNEHALKAWKVTTPSTSPKKNDAATEYNMLKQTSKISTQNGDFSPKKNGLGGFSGWHKEATQSGLDSKYSPKSLKTSPIMKPSSSQKSLNSNAAVMTDMSSNIEKRIKPQNNSRETANRSTELKRNTPKTAQSLKGLTLDKSTGEMHVREETIRKSAEYKLHHYLNEDQIEPLLEPERQLEVIEANLREIQGKNLFSGSPKHTRYPSFGSGIVAEKERRPSSRRTISQDSQSVQALQNFISPVDKERGLKERIAVIPAKPAVKTYSPLKESQESKESRSLAGSKSRKDIKLSQASLMQSLNLRKNLPLATQEDSVTPLSARSQRVLTNNSVEVTDVSPMSVHSGSTFNNLGFSKNVVDVYQRNANWLSIKQQKIQQIGVNKRKEEMKECTFKPYRNFGGSIENEYSQKTFNNYGVEKYVPARNDLLEKRSLSKEKKSLNSYNGIHHLKREVMASKTGAVISPKNNFFPRRETYENKVLHTNPH